MSKDKIKAYQVNSCEYSVIVFEKSGVAARRVGAAELNTEFEYIESCRRVPELDSYADRGDVPLKVLVESFSWSVECSECSNRVYSDELRDENWRTDDIAVCSDCISKA